MAKSKKLIVTYLDGTEIEVAAGPKAQVMAERHFGHSLLEMATAEEAYYLGWCALSVSGEYDKDFDTFLEVLDDVDIPESEMEKIRADQKKVMSIVSPTRPGRPSGITSS